MGYLTQFKVTYDKTQPSEEQDHVLAAPGFPAVDGEDLAEDICGLYGGSFVRNGRDAFRSAESYKFYEHEEDMRALSKRWPKVLFKMEGVGEDQDDHWLKYFQDGKMQVCAAVVTFPPYDPELMR
jgi:hypothetical protein